MSIIDGHIIVDGDELDPIIEAWQIEARLYEHARPATREDFNMSEDEWARCVTRNWLVVPYIGLVDPTDVHPLGELTEYLSQRFLEHMESAK
jgi:hypothetical protein